MVAQAVVRVDCVAGLEGDLLLGSGRRHGEVRAGGSGDIHCGGCVCVYVGERRNWMVLGLLSRRFMLVKLKK